MSIPGAASPLFLATTGAAGDFSIARSLRFNSADTAYLNRTPSSASNRRTFTFSAWIKKVKNDPGNNFYRIFGQSDACHVYFYNDKLIFDISDGSSTIGSRYTSQVFRDNSAWLHVVAVCNTPASTAGERMRLYVNGTEVTSFYASVNPSQNADTTMNTTNIHTIGYRTSAQGSAGGALDAYLTEINFVDGTALDPTSFGAFDDNGVWQAIDTAGLTFGTNGFRLKFADNSGATATTLGKDTSGNSNNWTPNNLSVGAAVNLTAQQNFDVVTYTGTGSARSITGLSFQPDFVWIKERGSTGDNHLFDSVRGATKALRSNETDAEVTDANELTAFNSDGFSLGSGGDVNANGTTTVAWCWKAGGAASSNTDGTITSSVSANNTYGFSVVTYTGNTSAGATVGHGLSSDPKFVLVKCRNSAEPWVAFHTSTGNTVGMRLTTAAADSGYNWWNSTTPSSTVFTIGNTGAVNNANTYVAYCWSEVAGFSKFSSYTGNGSGTGPVITGLGFKPKFVIIKESSSSGQSWQIHDAVRGGNKNLQANASAAEFTFTSVEFNDDGFSIKTSDNGWNRNGGTYIYAAFAATSLDQPGIDSLVDTPTNAAEPSDSGIGGEVVGNYATLNPLSKSSQTNIVLANGNLEASNTSSSGQGRVHGTIAISSGKWYFEATVTGSSNFHEVGIIKTTENLSYGIGFYAGGYAYIQPGTKFNNNSTPSYGASYTTGDTIGVAFDADNGTLVFYKNGASQGTAFTGLSGTYYPAVSTYSSGANFGWTVNFGQRAFAYTNAGTNRPSADYKSLNTANLPTPTIADGSQYFDTKLYSGNLQHSVHNKRLKLCNQA